MTNLKSNSATKEYILTYEKYTATLFFKIMVRDTKLRIKKQAKPEINIINTTFLQYNKYHLNLTVAGNQERSSSNILDEQTL